MKHIIILLFIFTILNSINAQVKKTYQWTEFPRTLNLKGEKMETDTLVLPCDISLIESDKVLIQNCEGNIFFDIVDLRNGDITLKLGRKGRGPGELIGPNNFQYIREMKKLFVYDVVTQRIVTYDLKKTESNNFVDHVLDVRFGGFYIKSVFFMEDRKYFCVLLGDKDGYRLCMLNESGRLINKFSQFPEVGKKYPTDMADGIIKTLAEITPDRKNIVVAFNSWDKIEIYDETGNLFNEIYGPKYKIPEIHLKNSNVYPKNKIECYNDIATGPANFMVLYYGLQEPKDVNVSEQVYKYILEFDYEGNPIKKYILDPGIFSFTVDWNAHIIYGISISEEPSLYRYKF